MTAFYAKVEPVVNSEVVALCRRRYHNHPRGCPNWGKKQGCPPKARPIAKVIDLRKPTYCIYNAFDLASHVNRMRERHPAWTHYQLRCCLYWQGTARKHLKEKIKMFLRLFPEYTVLRTPEACGVDVTATMASAGILLEWPPEHLAYQVALAGVQQGGRR